MKIEQREAYLKLEEEYFKRKFGEDV